MSFQLKVLQAPEGKPIGIKLPLVEGPNLAGRVAPPCLLLLDGKKVSKRHCTFTVSGAKLSVEDHGSSNGVFLNGKKISRSDLKSKDRLVVGEFLLEVTES